MRNLKVFVTIILISSFSVFLLSGCEGDEQEEDPVTEQSGIYFRLVQNLSYPNWSEGLWCDMVSGNFKDDNPGVPNNALFDHYYGPLEPGTYNASLQFDVARPESTVSQFSYTLESPPAGYKRMYTKLTRIYNTDLNRCVNMTTSTGTLTYVDIPIE